MLVLCSSIAYSFVHRKVAVASHTGLVVVAAAAFVGELLTASLGHFAEMKLKANKCSAPVVDGKPAAEVPASCTSSSATERPERIAVGLNDRSS